MKYTKTTSYLASMVNYAFSNFRPFNFINCYLGDHGAEKDYNNHICVRVSPDDFTDEFREIQNAVRKSDEYVADYDLPNMEVMFVFKLPEKYRADVELFKLGKYSKMNRDYVNEKFEKGSKKFKVFTKDPGYRAALEDECGLRLPEDAELASIPNPEEEVFRFNNKRGW